MKRVVPILLCMSFILSLCSMTTMATGENEPALLEPSSTGPELPEGSKQLYYMLNSNALTSLDVKALNGGLLDFCYKNENDTLMPIPVDTTFQTLGTLGGSLTYRANTKDWVWDTAAVAPNKDGFLRATFGGQNYDIFARILPAEFGVYTADTAADANYVPRIGGKHTVNYNTDGNAVYIISDDSFPINGIGITDGRDAVTCQYINADMVKLTLVEGFSGSITFTANLTFQIQGEEITRDFNITFTDGKQDVPPQEDNDDAQGGMVIGGLIEAAHKVEDNDRYSSESGQLAPFNATKFSVYDGEKDVEVYMGPTFYFGPNANVFGASSDHGMVLDVEKGEHDFIGVRPAFFVKLDNSEYQKVTNEELLDAIAALGLTYTIELDCTPGEFGGIEYAEPKKFPDCYSCDFDVTGDICSGYAYKMSFENRGAYVATLTVSCNDVPLGTSQSVFLWNPLHAKKYTATNTGPRGTIDAINKHLSDLGPLASDISVMIYLPAGNFEGYLQTPANLRGVNVFFYGATDKDGNLLTTITGGLMGSGIPRDIYFKGAGANSKSIPSTWGEGQMLNQASLPDAEGGYGYVDFRNCILEGYDYALYSHGGPVKGATECTFINNNAAILIDCQGTSAHFRYNTFRNNGVAFEVKRIGSAELRTEHFTGSIFIDNEADVVSNIEQNIFMPGVFFGKTNGSDTIARECITNKPNVSNATKKRVFTYPQAANPDRSYDQKDMMYYFSEFIYRTDFYASNDKKGPMISKNLAATFPIPAEVLKGNTFRIMDPEKPNKIVKISFSPANQNS